MCVIRYSSSLITTMMIIIMVIIMMMIVIIIIIVIITNKLNHSSSLCTAYGLYASLVSISVSALMSCSAFAPYLE